MHINIKALLQVYFVSLLFGSGIVFADAKLGYSCAKTPAVEGKKVSQKSDNITRFGAPLECDTQEVSLDKILSSPTDFTDKKLITQAQVIKVCQKKGCWMEVRDKVHQARVTFKDYGFFVPKDFVNKTVKLQGRLVAKTISISDQKHFLEDEGRSKSDIDAVKESKNIFEWVADGIELVQ